MGLSFPAAVLGAAVAAAGVSGAYAAPPRADALARAVLAEPPATARPVPPRMGLRIARSRFAPADPLPPGIARTSLDRRLEEDGALASVGYLCGLNPGQKMSGAAGAAGYDPMGKFLGARLSIAFR